MNTAPLLLRVTSVRSRRPGAFGGAIFAGSCIDQGGEVLDAGRYIVVRAKARVLSGPAPQPGQWWEVEGPRHQRALEINGYQMVEEQVEATRATLVRPSGEHIVALMATNPDFEGIGAVKARRLWERFGDRVYEILDAGDVTALSEVLTPDCSEKAIKAWARYGDSDTLRWLQDRGFEVPLGRKLMDFFGSETVDMVKEDPYRLLSFCATWREVDQIAGKQFEIALDDPRRLNAAVEEACYRVFTAGHTITSTSALERMLTSILGGSSRFRSLSKQALERGQTNGSYIIAKNGVQPLGAAAMESVVAQAIAARLALVADAELLSEETADHLLREYESEERFVLNREQRLAVHLARKHAFACITGGAGVGKTTVLKALYKIFDGAGVSIIQLALAGRAAKRMHEATGRAASTIASFLRVVREDSLTGPLAVIVDEASMVDIIAMSRVCEVLPANVRLILVGDPNQLMPVGPGLVLHSVVTVEAVPQVELTTVKRYGDEIRHAAGMIREGKWPNFQDKRATDVVFVNCKAEEAAIASTILGLYLEDPANTQILSSHRRGAGGTESLNGICQRELTQHKPALTVWNGSADCYEHTGLHQGDTILCTRNLWHRGLQNGSLGTIVEIESEPVEILDAEGKEAGYALAWALWDDGVRRPLQEDILDDIELGYAITVHKAQGSQWPRVIVPVLRNRLLDRTLLYTAVTRAQSQVILVGDEEAARAAVIHPPRARLRLVGLGDRMRSAMASGGGFLRSTLDALDAS